MDHDFQFNEEVTKKNSCRRSKVVQKKIDLKVKYNCDSFPLIIIYSDYTGINISRVHISAYENHPIKLPLKRKYRPE